MINPEPELELQPGKRPKIEVQPQRQLSVQGDDPSILSMIGRALESGDWTPDKVGIMERLCDLKLKVDAIEAEKAFAKAFNELLQDMPKIDATTMVPNKDGSPRYYYTPIEEIDAFLRPVALKHGFSYWFEEGEIRPDKITALCVVQHTSGHKRSTPYTVRMSGPPGSSTTQADGSTHSYAKRNALCNAFAIVIQHQDDDARLVGSPIDPAKAVELRQRVRELKKDEAKFLRFAGVEPSDPPSREDYCKILDSNLEEIERRLTEAEEKTKS